MLGIVDYGSDGGSDSESEDTKVASIPKPQSAKPLPPPAKDVSTKSTLGLSLPPPKTTKRRNGPVKIMVELPKLASKEGDDDESDGRQVKKPRVEGSNGGPRKPAGSSSLVAMLPAPTKKAVAPRPVRMLGGGVAGDGNAGISFGRLPVSVNYGDSTEESPASSQASTAFLPPSMVKGKGKAAPEEKRSVPTPSMDFFSLGPTSTRTTSSAVTSATTTSIPTLSSAPVVEEYKPPPPTPLDPYPGYYQLPSGQWAAYDPAYYKSHWQSWQPEASAESQMGKRWEGADADGLQSVDALEELKRGQLAEREARKNITASSSSADQPAAPNMNMKGSKVGNRARSRHQLSTLLNEAYENRAALEEKIAQGKRNKKEGGMKYGF